MSKAMASHEHGVCSLRGIELNVRVPMMMSWRYVSGTSPSLRRIYNDWRYSRLNSAGHLSPTTSDVDSQISGRLMPRTRIFCTGFHHAVDEAPNPRKTKVLLCSSFSLHHALWPGIRQARRPEQALQGERVASTLHWPPHNLALALNPTWGTESSPSELRVSRGVPYDSPVPP